MSARVLSRPGTLNRGPVDAARASGWPLAPSVRDVLHLLSRAGARLEPDASAPGNVRVQLPREALTASQRDMLRLGLDVHRAAIGTRCSDAVLRAAFPALPPGALAPGWRPILALLADVCDRLPPSEQQTLPAAGMPRVLALERRCWPRAASPAVPDDPEP